MSNIPSQLTESSPENVVAAAQGSFFYRTGDDFYISENGKTQRLNLPKKTFAVKYKNEIWYPTLKEDTITFLTEGETWIKSSGGSTKKGWRKLSGTKSAVSFRPVPASTIILGDILSIASGYQSSYFLKTNGDLWSTGQNGYGQLGIGNDVNSTASLSISDVKLVASSCEGYFAGIVKNDGTLWFTGNNSTAQFGNGTNTSQTSWTETILEGDITASGAIVDLATGAGFSALLMSDNTLWAATDDYLSLSSTTFTQIASNVKSISAGGYHLLYIKNDDTLWGIGENWDGQLGNGSSPYWGWDDPYQIDSNVKFCAGMGYHTGYIKNDDTLWMTGGNWNGQLCTTYLYSDSVYAPVQVATDVKFVGGGDSQTFYIKNDGKLYGAGYNDLGEIGVGDYDDVCPPQLIDTDVTKVLGGNEHTLYLKSDKTVYGMGNNTDYQLGEKAYPYAMYSADATNWTRDGVTDFIFTNDWNVDQIYWRCATYADGKFIAGGGEGFAHTNIMYSSDGKIWNSGSIDDVNAAITGIAYNGTDTYVAVSNASAFHNDGRAEVFTSSDGINWVSGSLNNTSYKSLKGVKYLSGKFVAFGYDRLVTSTDGINWTEQTLPYPNATVRGVAYGNDKYIATSYDSRTNNASPTTFISTFESRSVDSVHAGYYHGVLVSGSTLYGAGSNYDGELGLGYNQYYNKFTPIATDVKNATCTGYHTIFVKNDGTLWAAGANYSYDLGDGTGIKRRFPMLIDTNVSQSYGGSAAYRNIVYIKNDNTLFGIGQNSNGQLGNWIGYTTSSIQLDTNVVSAALGGRHILYIKDDGTLWGAGWNNYGQLGTNDTDDRSAPYQIDTNVAYCAAGEMNSFYIKTDGSLYGIGRNDSGQLGLGDYSTRLTASFITSSVAQVSATANNTHFVTQDGKLYAMGFNGNGQFGTGNTTDSNVPVYIRDGVSSVACGGQFTYLTANDGQVFACGYDSSGQLGNNTPSSPQHLYSTDAETWHTSSILALNYADVAFGNGRFVMVEESYRSLALSSTDGTNWTSSYITTSSMIQSSKIIFDGTKFVVSGIYSEGADRSSVATSLDGVTWTQSSLDADQYWEGLAYGDGKYVLLANNRNGTLTTSYGLTIK